ncbi:hypothetical protein BC835DRAFT_1311822, partial [Cytidiella melzeri]
MAENPLSTTSTWLPISIRPRSQSAAPIVYISVEETGPQVYHNQGQDCLSWLGPYNDGASLKLAVWIAEGCLWTMVAGGGASVVHFEAITPHAISWTSSPTTVISGHSGAPTDGQIYEYAKTT